MQTVDIISIAAGNPDLLNALTMEALRGNGRLVLRTGRTPLVSWLKKEKISFSTLDYLYESMDDFNMLAGAIADRLWSLAEESRVVYAVPDVSADTSVAALYNCRPADGRVRVIPGIGLSDVFRSVLCPSLKNSDLRTMSATDFLTADYDPNTALLITELDNPILAGDVKIHLSSFLEDEYRILYLHDQEEPMQLMLYELDRQQSIDHLSAILIPSSGYRERNSFVFADLMRIMDRLRAPDGCPWDSVQTHESLRPYMIEEAWECVAAIDEKDWDHLAEELGDLLFQIAFHASIGKSYDEFTVNDTVNAICRKMIHRHPHVFATRDGVPSAPTLREWESLKRTESGRKSVAESLEDVPESLPALKYAAKMFKKLSLLPGSSRPSGEILSKLQETIAHVSGTDKKPDETFAEVLLLISELCFCLNLDAEILLHNAVRKLKQEYQSSADRNGTKSFPDA